MFVLFSIVPFNIVKGIIVSAVTIALYKPISRFLEKIINNIHVKIHKIYNDSLI